MTHEWEEAPVIAAATAALPAIVATFEEHEQPVNGGFVAFTVGRAVPTGANQVPPIHSCWYVWRDGAPGELLDESAFKERTRDAATGSLTVPTWAFHLAPIARDEWYFEHWFAAPLRMWLGEKAGNRVKEQGASFRARRTHAGWDVKLDDVLTL